MNRLLFLLPAVGLTACAGDRSPESSATPVASVPDYAVASADDREPGRIHTYVVNDYIDPNNPRIMHQGHSVDVVEQDERWNLHPTVEEGTATEVR